MSAGGLFHFRKDSDEYSIKPVDYPLKPLYAPHANNRLLNEFFLYVLHDVHTWQGLGALRFASEDPEVVKLVLAW